MYFRSLISGVKVIRSTSRCGNVQQELREAAVMLQHKKFGVFGLAICTVAVSLLIPWAFHMGGRLTPLYWWGTGILVARSGTYPLYVLMYPTMERANGLQGWASLCTARNTVLPLEVNGRFRGGWWTLNHAAMELGLFETQDPRGALFDPSTRGSIDLFGSWSGPELILDDRAEHLGNFRSGLRIEHASVTLKWGSKSDFKTACSNISNIATSR
ncbi:MAG TPA: hypothetical protein VFA89_03680 [Terriglobales bacterium]|nr:hypothetical protein [Terriglobales bacterium]